jgi:hypothetical protein
MAEHTAYIVSGNGFVTSINQNIQPQPLLFLRDTSSLLPYYLPCLHTKNHGVGSPCGILEVVFPSSVAGLPSRMLLNFLDTVYKTLGVTCI